MADTDVRRRPAPGLWPWVVGLLVLALVAWGAVELLDRRAVAPPDATVPATGAP